MSFKAISWAFEVNFKPASHKLVLIALARYADETGKCWPSAGSLMVDCSVSRRTVFYALTNLEEAGLIRREERRRSDGTRTSDNIFLAIQQGATDCVQYDNQGATISTAPCNQASVIVQRVATHESSLEISIDDESVPAESAFTDLCMDAASLPQSRRFQQAEVIDSWVHLANTKGVPMDVILEVIVQVASRKKDGPPNSMKYFERPIIEMIASYHQPLPRGPINGKRKHKHVNPFTTLRYVEGAIDDREESSSSRVGGVGQCIDATAKRRSTDGYGVFSGQSKPTKHG